MTCDMGWWHPEENALLSSLPYDQCIQEDTPYLQPYRRCPMEFVRVGSASKAFGRVQALDDVTFAVQSGKVLGIIGASPR